MDDMCTYVSVCVMSVCVYECAYHLKLYTLCLWSVLHGPHCKVYTGHIRGRFMSICLHVFCHIL